MNGTEARAVLTDHTRKHLAELEAFEAWLEEYGEHHDLLFLHRDTIRSNDLSSQRCNGCAQALVWLQSEMKVMQKNLQAYEDFSGSPTRGLSE